MIPLLTAEEMQSFERVSILAWGIPSLVLQEHAAAGALALMPEGDLHILAGPGNNGGDALALARLARLRGRTVEVWTLASDPPWQGDAAHQAQLWKGLGGGFRVADDPGAALASFTGWVVDGLFGLGTRLPLRGMAEAWVRAIQASEGTRRGFRVLALDQPTGLDPSDPEITGPVIRADLTACFGCLKICHGLMPAKACCGEIHVVPIPLRGVPEARLHLLEGPEGPPATTWNTHKRERGHVAIRAGRVGMSGAAVLAALGALRAGAGLVTVLTDDAIRSEVAMQVPEAMVRSWDGTVPDTVDVLLAGPGGVDDLPDWKGPLVLDASALKPGEGRRWMDRPGTVITPHPGEFLRLFGWTRESLRSPSDRMRAVRQVATGPGVLVLKGAQTLVAGGSCPETWVNPTGHPGLSTGGTGDFLAGMVAARVGQALQGDPGTLESRLKRAAGEAVWLHGAAADRLGPGPILVRDLGPSLSDVMRTLHGGAGRA